MLMLTNADVTRPGSLHTKSHCGESQAQLTLGCIQLGKVYGHVYMGGAKDFFAGPASGHYTHGVKM